MLYICISRVVLNVHYTVKNKIHTKTHKNTKQTKNKLLNKENKIMASLNLTGVGLREGEKMKNTS